MQGVLGIALIGIGLYIVYQVMNGRAVIPAGNSGSGTGGESLQSYIRLHASNGGFK